MLVFMALFCVVVQHVCCAFLQKGVLLCNKYLVSYMPKVDALPQLQVLVCAHVKASSACELGRISKVHRSTVLRFCQTGRATASTARKLSAGIAATVSYRERAEPSLAGSSSAAVVPQNTSTDLLSLRSMLQTLISLIDAQYFRSEQSSGGVSLASTSASVAATQNA